MSQQIDSLCDVPTCGRLADWRATSADRLFIFAAACREHRDQVRAGLIRALQLEAKKARIDGHDKR